MAFSYTDFQEDIGKLIKHYDLQGTDGTNLDADRDEILTAAFNGSVADSAWEGLASAFDGWQGQYTARRATLASYVLRRMQDRITVLDEIGAVTNQSAEVLGKLIDFYALNSKSVNASVVTLGSVSAGGANVGTGTVLTTKVLDGVTSPGFFGGINYPPHLRYKGVDSELCSPTSETITLICAADSFDGGLTEGYEQFKIGGRPALPQHSIFTEGSGDLGSVTCLHGAGLLLNADFENFTSNVPDNWTIDTGTAGTHIFGNASEFYHGLKSLQFAGTGALAAHQISQAVAAGTIKANKRYCVIVRVKADATIAAGVLGVIFTGTGYTAGATESISIAAASLPTSWTLYSFFINMPASIPSDFKLVVKWTGTPTNAKNVYIDDIAFGPVDYRAGFGLVVPRGSVPFVRNDRFTFAVSATEGVVQRFMRRAFGIQMPSNNAAAETWLDSTAT